VNTLIYVGTHDVEHVWVSGKLLYNQGVTTTIDKAEINKLADSFAEKIKAWDLQRRTVDLAQVKSQLKHSSIVSDRNQLATNLAKLKELKNHNFHWLFFASQGLLRGEASLEDLKEVEAQLTQNIAVVEQHINQ